MKETVIRESLSENSAASPSERAIVHYPCRLKGWVLPVQILVGHIRYYTIAEITTATVETQWHTDLANNRRQTPDGVLLHLWVYPL